MTEFVCHRERAGDLVVKISPVSYSVSGTQDDRADIYAIACLYIELITGQSKCLHLEVSQHSQKFISESLNDGF